LRYVVCYTVRRTRGYDTEEEVFEVRLPTVLGFVGPCVGTVVHVGEYRDERITVLLLGQEDRELGAMDEDARGHGAGVRCDLIDKPFRCYLARYDPATGYFLEKADTYVDGGGLATPGAAGN